jgi:hypothetical protein
MLSGSTAGACRVSGHCHAAGHAPSPVCAYPSRVSARHIVAARYTSTPRNYAGRTASEETRQVEPEDVGVDLLRDAVDWRDRAWALGGIGDTATLVSRARSLLRVRYGESRSVRVTGRSPRLARPRKIAGNAVTVPECPRCMLTIDPGRADPSTTDTIASGPGSV